MSKTSTAPQAPKSFTANNGSKPIWILAAENNKKGITVNRKMASDVERVGLL